MPLILDHILKKQFFLSLILVILLPIILIAVLLVAPTKNRTASLKNELVQAKNTQEVKAKELRNLNKSLSAAAKIALRDINVLKELLPAERDIEGLLQVLEDKAKEAGFILKTIEISDASPQEDQLPRTKTLKVAVNFTGGDYKSFKNLLSTLEKNARILKTSSANFTSEGSYFLNLETYWLDSVFGAPLQIDTEFFQDPIFKILREARRELKTEPKGNENPFL